MYEELFKDSEEFVETDHPGDPESQKAAIQILFYQPDGWPGEKPSLITMKWFPFILRKMMPEFNPYLYLNKAAPLLIYK